MPLAVIFDFARVMRAPIVVSCTKNAFAISGTVRPPTMRSVRAIRASIASAGWQQMKISRSRSSSMTPSGSGDVSYTSIASLCLASRVLSRLIRSIAFRVAVVVSHAPGAGGMPSSGHRSAAVAKASAAASSAVSRLPKRLASVATTRAHSSRWARVSASRTSLTRAAAEPDGSRDGGCRLSNPLPSASGRRRGRGPR